MGKAIAIQSCTFSISPLTISGSVTAQTSPSTKFKINGQGVFFGPLTVLTSALSQGSFQAPPTSFTINPTAIKTKHNSLAVILENDFATLPITFTDPGTGTTTVISVTVKVSNAGQTKMLTD